MNRVRVARGPVRPHPYLHGSALHVRLLYGSGFPHTPKLLAEDAPVLVDGARNSRRDRGYLRFDVGMTQTLNVAGYKVRVREEVANVFDQFNVVGYTYLPTPAGTPVELRNALGRRIYNMSLGVDLARTGDND